ncbi:MAG: hypothetical protein D6820_13375 [Lentisphaerae bacterium]|nr:MAG: hypothetical protein D6820_13375 [Lentisphaerota bacterium]
MPGACHSFFLEHSERGRPPETRSASSAGPVPHHMRCQRYLRGTVSNLSTLLSSLAPSPQPPAPAIICSGYGRLFTEELRQELAPIVFLEKPVVINTLREHIRKFVHDRQAVS